eukprot:TRINITY_DN9982_c0_g1_i1.p1 TRINITY_DN9982_c0_g1~~TRINITY_DN9982_c0_g1_i1.p1  ORF type:complete len:513 (-),score=90.93 TRINITY_DN9982_c0_g1_i1:360-1898(-)
MAADEHAILAETLLQESALPHAQAGSKRRSPPGVSAVLPGHVGQREYVSTGFMNSLCAEVDSLLESSSVLSDVKNLDVGSQVKAASPSPMPISPGYDSPQQSLASTASPGRSRKETPDKSAERSPWSIKPRAHAPTGYPLFSHVPESQASSPTTGKKSPSSKSSGKNSPSDTHAVYKRSVEFLEQKKAKLAEQIAKKEQQENDTFSGPQISAMSKKLVADRYKKPWEGKTETSRIKSKALAEMQEQRARESAEHTFQPQIDKRSKDLFRHVLDNGEPWHYRMHSGQNPSKSVWKDRSKHSKMEENLTFTPEITQKARQLEERGYSSDQLHTCHARDNYRFSPASEHPSLEHVEHEVSDHEALEAMVQRFVIDGNPKKPSTQGAAKLTEALRQRTVARAPGLSGGLGPTDAENAEARPFEETAITPQSSASEVEGDIAPETAGENDIGTELAQQSGGVLQQRVSLWQAQASPEQEGGSVVHTPSQKAARKGTLESDAKKSAQTTRSEERRSNG